MMIHFSAIIEKFDNKGEKTGWSYIDIPAEFAEQLKPGTKTSFLVKGKLDEVVIKGISLLPMGGGNFIIALKSDLRKKLYKGKGAMLRVQLEADDKPYELNEDLLACLQDAPEASANFNQLPFSHRKYFSKWIESAKGETTKAKRIAQTIDAMQYNLTFGEMIKKNQADKLL